VQHELNVAHPVGHARAIDEHAVNEAYELNKHATAPVAPHLTLPVTPGFERKGGISSGMARKEAMMENGAQSTGLKKKGMELLKQEEKKEVDKLLEGGFTHGLGKKGW
jgi:hypothetical protein